ncbi:MAG: glycosyltransferase [Candidatus Omnitrophica bacterium]|nr:glycosyltransferase [Candidatus Omnitrophota bacterium]
MYIAMISEHASPLAALGGVDSGGQNVYVAQLADHLVAQGHEVDVFTRREDPKILPIITLKRGLRIIQVPAGPPQVVPKEQLYAWMDDFTLFMRQFFQGNPKKYDLIHANFWMSGLVAMRLKQILGQRFVITFHALGKIRRMHLKDADGFPDCRCEIEKQIMQNADGIVAECPQDWLDMVKHYQAGTQRMAMIPCGFDPKEFQPLDRYVARNYLNIPDHEEIFLQLGRMVPRKGVETAIRGYASFYRNTRRPSRLLIVGGNSMIPDVQRTPEIGRLQKIAEDEGVSSLVHFIGQVSRQKLKYYYSASDAFVTVPWYEPFGITPLEAMACGIPVIGSNVGGIKYTVIDKVTGFLIPPQDVEAVAHCMKEMCLRPCQKLLMGQQALQRVRQFTWEKVALTMGAYFQKICHGIHTSHILR